MQDFGQLLLVLNFFLMLATALTAFAGALTRNGALMRGARSGFYAITLLNIAMAIVLTHGFLTHEFSNKYIATYSDKDMPTVYLLAAFWGGEKGALLFWVTSLSIFGAIAVYTKRERSPVYLSWVVGIITTATLFMAMLMVFETSPFETFMTQAPPDDGQGLNPLLQNPVMAFHPPSLLTGYILFTIPFAFGMAALITRKLDEQWITDTRRWTIVSWTFLSIGLLLGARWAYMEIGWGFWWMWDPVENAGLIPWFTATAFLHSVMIQERRGMLKRWNMVLLVWTFMLTIFGTFLTRSQLIDSIHAFANSELPNYFFGYLVVIFIVGHALIAWRWKDLKSEGHIEGFWSRESMFVLNNVFLVLCAFIVTWGTLMGKLTESQTIQELAGLDHAKAWTEDDFNAIFVPVGVALIFLMGVGPLISWRRATAKNFRRNFAKPLAWSAVATALLVVVVALSETLFIANAYDLGMGDAYARWAAGLDGGDYVSFLVYFLLIFVVTGIVREYVLGTRVRRKKYPGGVIANAIALTAKNPRRYGGYIVHIGIVFLFIAFTGKAFKVEEPERVMGLGQQHEIDKYVLTYAGQRAFWSEEEGCSVTRSTILVQPLRSTVHEDEVEALAAWLASRQTGPVHIQTTMDSPKMQVRFAEAGQRERLMTDFYLARVFKGGFDEITRPGMPLTLQYTPKDTRLLQSMPFVAMTGMRRARDRLNQGDLGVAAEIQGGSALMTLRFTDGDKLVAFKQRLAEVDVPANILTILDAPETGGVEVIDRATAVTLLPEVRFYAKHNTTTTEVAISGADFLEDVYVSMQPSFSGDDGSVKLFMVVFPLVNFLWFGSLMLIVGGVVCLTPRWLGRTIISLVQPIKRAPGLLIALGAASLLAAASGPAHAARLPQPTGFAPPVAGDAAADVAAVLKCACDEGGKRVLQEYTLADAACVCPLANADLTVIDELLANATAAQRASGRAKYEVLNGLVEIDPNWNQRIIYDAEAYEALKRTTLNVCAGERGMTLAQSKMSCSVRQRWMPRFRALLAAGVSPDDIQAYYIAENNVTQSPGTPWTRNELTTNDDVRFAFGLPLALVVGVLAGLGVLLWRNRKRPAPAAEREHGGASAGLTDDDRLRLADELDIYDV